MNVLWEALKVFGAGPVVGGLLGLATGGLLVSLTAPQLLPPTLFFGGIWYTRLLWMLVALSVGVAALRGLLAAIRSVRERGLLAALGQGLTSVRLAVWLIALLTLLGLISTLVPQLALNREVDLIARYGAQNYELLKRLGFFTIFNTPFAYAIVTLFVLNLSACTVKRLRASIRYVQTPMAPKRPKALRRMPHHAELTFALGAGAEAGVAEPERARGVREHVRRVLGQRGFRVREAPDGQLLAEKWRWERFSIDVFHISLLVAIGALLITELWGYNYLEVAYEGDVLTIPGRDFKVRVEEFWSENYPGTERVMDWKTRLSVLDAQGRVVKTGITEVNHPFSYQGISIYQAAMGEDWLGSARVVLRIVRVEDTQGEGQGEEREVGMVRGRVGEEVALPEAGLRVRIRAFLPDFALIETPQGRQAYSKSLKLLNPAVYVELYDEGSGERVLRTWSFSRMPELQRLLDAPYRVYLEGMTAQQFTGLEISWDPGLPFAYGAFAVMTLMLIAHVALRHQMLWVSVQVEPERGQGRVIVGGRSRKGEFPNFDALVRAIAAHPTLTLTPVPTTTETESPFHVGEGDGKKGEVEARERPVSVLEEGS